MYSHKEFLMKKEFRMKKMFWTFVCILLVAATLGACSSKAFPTGTYTALDTMVEYRGDGTFTWMSGDDVNTEGTYSVEGDEIQFTDSYCAEEDANPGTYKWQHEDGKLKFELIEDPCEGRRDVLTVNWFGPK
jgi:hypothetical protein